MSNPIIVSSGKAKGWKGETVRKYNASISMMATKNHPRPFQDSSMIAIKEGYEVVVGRGYQCMIYDVRFMMYDGRYGQSAL